LIEIFQKINRRVALIYKFYLTRNISLPYLKTLLTVMIITFIHIYIVFNLFDVFQYLPVWYINKVDMRGIDMMCFALLSLVFFFFAFRKKRLLQYSFTDGEMIGAWKSLIVYSGIMLFILMIIIKF